MKARVVIGANFGDEGKGLMTDFLAHQYRPDYVVRFNGGAQAGHTVVTPDGKRHVFSHFNSASFQGIKTFLGPQFVVHPILFFRELNKLKDLGVSPVVMVDPRALITTPYDMLINQAYEHVMGFKRRGSCGVGFGETIERNFRTMYIVDSQRNMHGLDTLVLRVEDLDQGIEYLHYKLQVIRREWVPTRLSELGISDSSFPELRKQVMSDDLMWKFIKDLVQFQKNVQLMFPFSLRGAELLFEGAQGLGLDQADGTFPNVTRSFTGIKNVQEIATDAGVDRLEVHYLTRAYLTRHGAGPLKHELKHKPYPGIKEKTNVTNQFQGAFRYANLDVDDLVGRIKTDLRYAKLPVDVILGVTCVDQVGGAGRFYEGGKLRRVSKGSLTQEIARRVANLEVRTSSSTAKFAYESNGPTHEDVRLRLI